jgi:ubiquinone/menaquinone biosynthesis C-methylase UbiE
MTSTDRVREIREYWDGQADSYDDQFDHTIGSSDERAVWERIFTLVTGSRTDLRILDLGTGTGFLALELARRGHRVTGIDLSPEMLEMARTKAIEEGLSVDFEPGDAEQPVFPNGSFDLVISRHLFWAMTDQAATLSAWHRILRAGGCLAILDGDWCTDTPEHSGSSRTPTAEDVRDVVQASEFTSVHIDKLADLSEALNRRASTEGRDIDHFQRYLVRAYRAA